MCNRSYMEEEGTVARDYVPKPTGKLSPDDLKSDTFNLYFKGLIREETSGQLLSGFGFAICREEDDNLLFQMKGTLHDSFITVLEAELIALKLGLTQAVSLGIEHVSICCDYLSTYELVMGRSAPVFVSTALLLSDVQRIRQQLTSCIPVLVTRDQTKFAYNLAMESISIPMTSPADQEKTCGICFREAEPMFSVALCNHQFCVECIKQHIEVSLVQGGVPRCPNYGCKSNLNLRTCTGLVTPKLKEIWEQRIKEESTPVCDRLHCPNPKCWALMSKTELLESEDGVRRCCLKCRKPFCINCKVLWHSNLSCKEYKTLGQNPNTISRQCKKCQHIIKVSHTTTNVTCRCGYSFCCTCGAQWKLGGCRHLREMVEDASHIKFLLMILVTFICFIYV